MTRPPPISTHLASSAASDVYKRQEKLRTYCASNGIPAEFVHVESLAQAKSLPCVFNNWAVFCHGKFATVNQLDGPMLEKLWRR